MDAGTGRVRLSSRTFWTCYTIALLASAIGSASLAGPADAALPRPVIVANAAGADNAVIAKLDVYWRSRALCSARLSAGRLSAPLPTLRAAAGGGGEWRWAAGSRAPGGTWHAHVKCTKSGSSAVATIRLHVPRSPQHKGRRSLVQGGTARGYSYDGYAGKRTGLGSSGGNPYQTGQCTWYAWSRRPDLPWFSRSSGNALNWISSAQQHGIPTGSVPVADAIVVFQPGQWGAGYYGHVAYVESVNGSTISIAEANYGGFPPGHHRTIPWSGLRFIYGGPANHPGQAPSPLQPAPPGTFVHHVYHTCANGACGLKLHSAPSRSAAVVGIKNDGDIVYIACQKAGDTVTGADGSTSTVWDKLSDGSYASDYYIDTSGRNGAFSPPIPQCSFPPAEAPAHSPDGHLDSVNRTDPNHVELVGWAHDGDADGAAVAVRALVDGVIAGQATASVPRADVGPHGFDFVVPIDGRMHTVCVQAVNIGGGQDIALGGCTTLASPTTAVVGDIDGDGYVGCSDKAILVANYGRTGSGLAGDLNHDGTVTIVDLSVLLSHWNQPPGEAPCPS